MKVIKLFIIIIFLTGCVQTKKIIKLILMNSIKILRPYMSFRMAWKN